MPAPQWHHLEHSADIGVCGSGASEAEAFVQAALALTALITDPAKVTTNVAVQIDCQAPDIELLFVDWLNAIIYEMASRKMLFGRFDVEINALQLHATVWGENISQNKHRPAVEIKGATYTALKVYKNSLGLWNAQAVVDV